MTDLPRALNRRGIYYGWVVLAAGTVGVIASVPGADDGRQLLHRTADRRAARRPRPAQRGLPAGTLASAFLLPFVGRLLDRVGARVMSVVAATGLAGSLLVLSVSPRLAGGLTAARVPPAWAGLAVLFVCFLGIRHFGQGS